MNHTKAVIMAGGQGTRLRSVSADLPKPMVEICGKPILQYQIENLRENGITDILLVIGYLGNCIRSYFGDGSRFGVQITYFEEDHPMGTAGALYYLRGQLEGDFLLLMGDLMLSVDFNRMLAAHKAAGGAATLFVHPNSHPYDSDVIVTDTICSLADFTEEADRRHRAAWQKWNAKKIADSEQTDTGEANFAAAHLVTGVLGKKEPRTGYYHNQVNAGIYVLSKKILDDMKQPKPKPKEAIDAELAAACARGAEEAELKAIKKSGKVDLDKDILLPLMKAREVYAYHSTEYVRDMGTPDRYAAVGRDLKNGIVLSRNLANMQKCIFLDRDGTINEYKGFISQPEDLILMPQAIEAIQKINASEYLAIVVTNQPVVARGACSFQELDEIQAKLETELGKAGAYIDGLLFCPHHPDSGFAGEVPALKFHCGCRKPQPGMLWEAARQYNIDLSKSWMAGDTSQDIQCGTNAGTRTALVKTGSTAAFDGHYDAKPDMVCENLLEAVERILREC